MATVQFYHLTTTPLERALPKLVENALSARFKTLIVNESDDYLESLNELLWIHDPASFIPHGSERDGNPQAQPVLLSTNMQPVNGATMLMVTSGTTPKTGHSFERILDIFDGNNAEAVAKARNRWTEYKASGAELSYLKQTESGGWEKKAG